jgi:hypothetical protein
MRVLIWNLALGAWIIVSSFALSQTPQSVILGYAVAVIVLSAAIAAQAKPGARYVVTAAALLLVLGALALPDLSIAARVNYVVSGALLLGLSLISPRRARWEGEETTPVTPPEHGHTARAG